MRCAAAARSFLPLPSTTRIHTTATASSPSLAAELDAADALHALLSTLPPSLPALLPCLSLLSPTLTPHAVSDALLCAAIPAASRLRLFLFSALSPRLRSRPLHAHAVSLLLRLSSHADEAMFDALADARAAGLPASSSAFAALVAAHSSAGRHADAVQAFSRMDEFQSRPTAFVYNTILKALVDSGVILLALALYNRMVAAGCAPNRATYNVLMDGLCKQGMAGDALKMFDEMLDRGIMPNVKIYTVLLSSLCNAGKIDEAVQLLGSMKDKGCLPEIGRAHV